MLRLRLGEDWSAEELLDLARGAEVRLDFGRAASNGGGSFWNLEIEETTTPALGSTFYRVDVATPTAYLNTILTNSIFERSVSTAFDFGPYLDVASGPTRWVFDDGLGSIAINPTRVGIAGVRAVLRQTLLGVDSKYTDQSTPFWGAPGGTGFQQWFLVNSDPQSRFERSQDYLNAGSMLNEDAEDIEGISRPSNLDLRDKGGEEGGNP